MWFSYREPGRLGHGLHDAVHLVDAQSLGRTLLGGRHLIAASHMALVGTGRSETVSTL